MKDEQIVAFVKLVVSAIQTNHPTQVEARKALTAVLEEADNIHNELAGTRIVLRGDKTVVESLVSHSMSRIKDKP